jgi:hypothetical protein
MKASAVTELDKPIISEAVTADFTKYRDPATSKTSPPKHWASSTLFADPAGGKSRSISAITCESASTPAENHKYTM